MPRRAPELSETELKRHMADSKRTKTTVKAIGSPRGLCIRLLPGKQSSAPCYLTYRFEKNGKVQWLPLGMYPEMSLVELQHAAAEAIKLKSDKDNPKNPIEARDERAAEVRARASAQAMEAARLKATPTVEDACNLYLTYAADRANVKASTERWAVPLINRLIIPSLGARKVADVTKKEVIAWHRSPAMRETSSQADGALRLLAKIFNLALEEDWRIDNPASRIKKLVQGSAKRRERTLNKDERRALARALRAMELEPKRSGRFIEPEAVGAIRALIFSAMRLQEVLTLRWDEVDFKGGWILKEDHKSSGRVGAKRIAITPQLEKVLRDQLVPDTETPLRKGSLWVFPSPFTPAPGKELGHFVGLQRVWDRVKSKVTEDEAALVEAGEKKPEDALSIEDVHLHDLRRTALSITKGDQSIEAISGVAGHASISTTERIYAHLELEKLRAGAEMIAAAIAKDMAEDAEEE